MYMLEGTILGLFYVLIGIVFLFILIGVIALLIFIIKKCRAIIKQRAIDIQTELNESTYSKL